MDSSDEELHELFKSIDVDNDHSLSLAEVVTFLKSITDDLSTENIENIFDSLDQSGDRSVDFTEFKGVLKQIQGAGWKQCEPPEDRSSIKEEEVRALFNMIDKDGSGELTKRETKKAAKLIKDRFGIEEVEEWLSEVDFDGDGVLSYEEFKMCFMANVSGM